MHGTARENEQTGGRAAGAGSGVGASATPLWAVLWMTWLGSFGTAVAWAGVFFVADEVYGYARRENLVLAIALGATYAVTAWFARPISNGLRALPRVIGRERMTSRAALVWLLVLGGASAAVPVAFDGIWTVWVFGLVYSPLTGLQWPAVEAYVSGGRRGAALNRAAGKFNFAWSSALVVAMWGTSVLIEGAATWVIGSLAVLHAACVPLVLRFRAEPAEHGEAHHEHPPERDALYRRLLTACRWTLMGSYVLHASLTPMLPAITGRLSVPDSWQPALVSVWMTTRLGVFLAMERWAGWHARWAVVPIAGGMMAAGYVLCVSAEFVGGAWQLGIGLAVLGSGIGAAYAAAIYYALEVGTTDVDAGGKHEAMIGVGYTIGPGIALIVLSGG